MTYKYNHVALGGTFDLLHRGHISLLQKAFAISKLVSIGVTADKFCKQSGKFPFENQAKRKNNLLNFLRHRGWAKRANLTWLDNIYGSTSDKTLEAIIVSKETIAGANEVNKKRTQNKLKKLTIVVCPDQIAGDGKKITSTRIRAGEISQNGQVYLALLLKTAGKRFSEEIRKKLKKPFGKIASVKRGEKFTRPIIAVGDVSTQNLLKNDILPDVSIVDFFVNRQRTFANLSQLGFSQPNPDYLVENIPGQISKDLILKIQKSIQTKSKGQIILVDGEEDLAFIPSLLLSPFPATIFYGQPQKGMIKTPISTETKEELVSILDLS